MSRSNRLILGIIAGVVSGFATMLLLLFLAVKLGVDQVNHIDDIVILLGFFTGWIVSYLVGRERS